MSIIKILKNEQVSNAEKLEAVAEVISQVREKYGNSEVEIPSVKVNSTEGYIDFSFMEDDSRVAILTSEALSIKALAAELSEQCPAMNIQRKVEELLATNPYFANIANGVTYEFL